MHNTTQNGSDNLPSYLQTNIIAQMLSIGGEGWTTTWQLLSNIQIVTGVHLVTAKFASVVAIIKVNNATYPL